MGLPTKRKPASTTPAHPTQGFGVPLTIAPHHFVVIIPRGSRQAVEIVEDLGMHTEGNEPDVIERVILPREVWSEIAGPVKRVFNERLKAHDLKPCQWKVGENRIDRLLGKELCVLAWAVEDLDPSQVANAVANWLMLRPEERWWLFGMTAATVGEVADRGKGWRVALRYALADTPQGGRPIERVKKPPDTDIYETLPLFQA